MNNDGSGCEQRECVFTWRTSVCSQQSVSSSLEATFHTELFMLLDNQAHLCNIYIYIYVFIIPRIGYEIIAQSS